MFKIDSAEIKWPKTCIACGTTEIEGGETYKHFFKAESDTQYGAIRQKRSAVTDAVIHLCKNCHQRTIQAGQEKLAIGLAKKRNGNILALLTIAIGVFLYPLTLFLPTLGMYSGFFAFAGLVIAWLGFSKGIIPRRIEESGKEILKEPFMVYLSLSADGSLSFANPIFYSIFNNENPKTKTYLVNLPGIDEKAGVLTSYCQGCCVSIVILLISVILYLVLRGVV